jgi:hypothetical protein
MKVNDMFHCLGLIANVAYIAMCKTSMLPLECVQHGGRMDHGYVPAFPNVSCGGSDDSEYNENIYLALGAILFYGAGFLTFASKIAYQAPRRFHDSQFRLRYRFLFGRWEVTTWWYGLCLLLRNILVSVAKFMFPNNGVMQVAWLTSGCACYAMACGYFEPWKIRVMTVMDALQNLLVVMVCVFGLGASQSEEDMASFQLFVYVPFVGCFVVPLLALVHSHLTSRAADRTAVTDNVRSLFITIGQMSGDSHKFDDVFMGLSDTEQEKFHTYLQIVGGQSGLTPQFPRRLNAAPSQENPITEVLSGTAGITTEPSIVGKESDSITSTPQ